ncbi:hypothetical protein GALL_271810 [mine drainage metagenome]|uniref:Uncharacterized protein n=1 Tax=mine drainage metagenome TaxID=410659 RepID=A0A1J5RN37_9ZZZZ
MMAETPDQEPPRTDTAVRQLSGDLRDVFRRGLTVQGWALVVERQPRPRAAGGQTAPLLTLAQQAQTRLKQLARAYLDQVQPQALEAVLAPADRLANLANALPPALEMHLKQGEWTGKTAADCALMVGALASAAAAGAQRGRDFSEHAAGWAAEVEEQATALREALNAVIERIDGPKGTLTALQGRIDKIRADITTALDQLVAGGQEVGDGVRRLGTGLLQGLRRHIPAKPSSPAKKEDEEATDAPPPPAEEDGAETADLLVETLTGTGQGAEKAYQAMAALEQANETLAALYLRLASARTDLAWARALADQADSLARGGASLAQDLSAMPQAWDDLAQGFQALSQRFHQEGLTLTGARALIAALGAEKQRSWAGLTACTTAIRRALAGMESLYPSVKA